MQQETKAQTDAVENTADGLVMRSKLDDLSVWRGVRKFWRVGVIAMLAAFSASLDGVARAQRVSATAGQHAALLRFILESPTRQPGSGLEVLGGNRRGYGRRMSALGVGGVEAPASGFERSGIEEAIVDG